MRVVVEAEGISVERVWSFFIGFKRECDGCVLRSVYGMPLWLRFYLNMCGGFGPWVDYACPRNGVACDEGAVHVDVFFWVPRRVIRADVGWVVQGRYYGYGGVGVFVCLSVVE